MMIGQARKKDSKEAAVLIYDAIHDIAHALTGEKEKEKVLKQLEAYFQQEHNRMSYRNCFVKIVDEKVIGIVVAYHGKDALSLDAPIVAHLKDKKGESGFHIDQEADEEDYYIDTVSVNPQFSGQGFGTELLQFICRHADCSGYSSISLNVEENNSSARRLYERLGFKQKKNITINNHTFSYLVKQLR